MDRIERIVLIASAALMAVFFAALVYAAPGWASPCPPASPTSRRSPTGRSSTRATITTRSTWSPRCGPSIRRRSVCRRAPTSISISAPLDVTHGLYIEHTNVNLMAVPGSVNAARFRLDTEGEYNAICHEYCGAGHHFMMGKFVVAPLPAPPAAPADAARCARAAALRAKGLCRLSQHRWLGRRRPDHEGHIRTHGGAGGRRRRRWRTSSISRRRSANPVRRWSRASRRSCPKQPLTAAEVHALVAYLETLEVMAKTAPTSDAQTIASRSTPRIAPRCWCC